MKAQYILVVSEKNVSAGMDFQIIHRVELTTEKVIEQRGGVVRCVGVEENQRSREVSAPTGRE